MAATTGQQTSVLRDAAMMKGLVQLERQVQSIYDEVLAPLAKRTEFGLSTSGKDPVGLPSVLFMGNHSSGKSSFINYLIGSDLQKTGLAPTDDGFTIITCGEKRDEFDGQSVVTHRDLPFSDLKELGPSFLSHLRLKTFPHELLKSVTLIDSPGMIDAAANQNSRGYDFPAAAREFAERADLILFFFDPDKPGTTGETVSIFTDTLGQLEHKLMIIMHKVDLFQNMRDFARTYGTLCWNLAKAIKTKDIPHIYNTYLPGLSRTAEGTVIPLKDFDASREEVISEIKRAPTRRTDNLVSGLYQSSQRLSMHARVMTEVARAFRRLRWKCGGAMFVTAVLTLAVTWFLREAVSWWTPAISFLVGALLLAAEWFGSRELLKRFLAEVTTEEGIEPFFRKAYQEDLRRRERADLNAYWLSVRKETLSSLRVLDWKGVANALPRRRLIRRLDQVMEVDVPNLRREIARHHTDLQRTAQTSAEG